MTIGVRIAVSAVVTTTRTVPSGRKSAKR